MAFPKDEINIKVDLKESLSETFYMKGKITCREKTILVIDFSCTLTSKELEKK